MRLEPPMMAMGCLTGRNHRGLFVFATHSREKAAVMVDKSYLLAKPPAPSGLKVFLDQRALPVAIDAAGSVELGLDRTKIAVRENPAMAMVLALGFGWVLALLLAGRRAA